MKIQKQVEYKVKEFNSEELSLSQRVFGLVPQAVYFKFDVDLDIDLDKNKLIYVYGLFGEGKTIFKDELKKQLQNTHYVIDYDDENIDADKKLMELFDFNNNREFLIRLFSTFGMFEMRNIFSKFSELSAGQQKRVRYMYLLYKAHVDETIDKSNCVVLIDEFLTFVDSLSAKVFAQGLRKFMTKHMANTLFFGFGCNDSICMYWEDLNIHMQNGKIYSITEVTDVDREQE